MNYFDDQPDEIIKIILTFISILKPLLKFVCKRFYNILKNIEISRNKYGNFIKYLIKNNQLNVLKWATAAGCPWHKYTFAIAAKFRQKEIFEWLLETNCHYDKKTCERAAKNGDIEILKLCKKNNFYWCDIVVSTAAKYNNFETVKWLIENDCPVDHITFRFAAENGNLEMLKWLKEDNRCPWDPLKCCLHPHTDEFGYQYSTIASSDPATIKWLV